MDKKRIQEQRMRSYFIEAAKEIIKDEGVGNLTVKNVSDRAGYAQGTLYNYFDNLDRLLFNCIEDFFAECKDFVVNKMNKDTSVKNRMINSVIAYSRYFAENPNVYRLIFMENLTSPPAEKIGEKRYVPEIIELLRSILEDAIRQEIINTEELTIIKDLIGNTIHGNLMFFVRDVKKLRNKQEVLKKIEREVNYLLKT